MKPIVNSHTNKPLSYAAAGAALNPVPRNMMKLVNAGAIANYYYTMNKNHPNHHHI